MVIDYSVETLLTELPKVELHLHLEGSIKPATFLRIAKRNHVDLPANDEKGIRKALNTKNFDEFLKTFRILCSALRSGQDFEEITYELGQYLAKQHIIYAEVMISIAQYHLRKLPLDELIHGAAIGIRRAEHDYNIQMQLAFDFGRKYGVAMGEKLLEEAIRNKKNKVIAWSIGGDETNHPAEQFSDIFRVARQAGLHTMAHAGEVAGPESIWGAIEHLYCQRIGHGIRSVIDPLLIEKLRKKNVTLDIAITSNLRTGAVSNKKLHPVKALYDAGIPITINTDDPVFFNTTLQNEYSILIRDFGFSIDDIIKVIMNAADAAFLPATKKIHLQTVVRNSIQSIRQELGI